MALIIDGYNLLHASDIFGNPDSADAANQSAFEQSRSALIDFVAESVGPKLAGQTTIVFDAAGAPPGLPNEYRQQQVLVLFARRYASADLLIGELIEQHPTPKELLVVSSDHAVQRSARQHGASYTDSEPWFKEQREELRRRLDEAHGTPDPVKKLRQGELSAEEVRGWLREFGG